MEILKVQRNCSGFIIIALSWSAIFSGSSATAEVAETIRGRIKSCKRTVCLVETKEHLFQIETKGLSRKVLRKIRLAGRQEIELILGVSRILSAK